MLFSFFYIVWYTLYYLLYLFVCMYLCVMIDGAQFEGPQEQGYEVVPEQQQYFHKGKWSFVTFRYLEL
jgi:hypothetical protein